MKPIRPILAGVVLVALAGCQQNGPTTRADLGVLQAQQAEYDDFDLGHSDVTPDTHFAAGQYAETQGRFAEAVSQYEQAVALDAKHERALYRLGVLQTRSGSFEPARKTWNAYIQATRGSAEAYGALGYCLELAGDPLGAEASYKQGIDADPKHQGVRVNYGLLLARQGRDGEATVQLAEALPMPAVLYNIGVVRERQGDTQQAAECYREALDLKPNFPEARQRLLALGVASAGDQLGVIGE
jgi:Tfp pilus assembly protein PilF